MTVPVESDTLDGEGKYLLTVEVSLAGETAWASAGHTVSTGQFTLAGVGELTTPTVGSSPLSCETTADGIVVVERAVRTGVRRRPWRRRLIDLPREGASLGGPSRRPLAGPTDNDRGLPLSRTLLSRLTEKAEQGESLDQGDIWTVGFSQLWREHGLDSLQFRTDNVTHQVHGEERVDITVTGRLAPPIFDHGFATEQVYTIHDDCTVNVETRLEPEGDLSVMPSIPRVDLDLTLPGDLECVTWYGCGPGESYVDSKQSSLVGRYERPVGELHTPYVRPQANGNRTDVRWATFTDGRGVGLYVSGDSLLDVTAHDYERGDLEAADHRHELPRRDEISVSLDHVHCGLGTGSCGPATLEKYRVEPDAFEFGVEFRPFVAD